MFIFRHFTCLGVTSYLCCPRRHVGDLGNIRENEKGEVKMTLIDRRVSLVGADSVIGKSMVVSSTAYCNNYNVKLSCFTNRLKLRPDMITERAPTSDRCNRYVSWM